MRFPTRKQTIFIALAIYLAAVALSTSLLVLKKDALAFHQRDYNYFVEQAARLADPRLANSFALQIEGYNFLGLQGIEGVKNLFHAIHAEYFRYIYTLLYWVFRDPLAIYIFYSLVFFSPILYLAILPHPDEREHLMLLLVFSLLYLLFPATINAVGSDLRPRALFAAGWSLLVLAIYFDRPFWEKVAFFILLIGIREEGILLGAVAIGLNYIMMEGRPDRKRQALILTVLDAAALILFLAFMAWGGYTRVDRVFNPLVFVRAIPLPVWIGILGAIGLVILALRFAREKGKSQYHKTLFLLCYSLALVLTGFQWLRDTLRWFTAQSQISPAHFIDIYIMTVTNETTALVFYLLIVLVVILWGFTRGGARKLLIAVCMALVVLFTATTMRYYPPLISKIQQNVEPAGLVWDFALSHDRYTTRVLADYDTYQAFYNYDKTLVYNRLPLWDTLPEKRYYPANKNALIKQLQKGIDFAVISRSSQKNVLELAQQAGLPAVEVAANDRYAVIQFGITPGEPGN